MTALSKTGARRLAEAEAAIERGLSTFMEVGAALMSIREERLYRQDYDTFEHYCLSRWKFSSRRANQLMDAAEIGTMVPISNERQARALKEADDPQEVYAEAEQRGDTTAAGIARVVNERKPKVAAGASTRKDEEGTPGLATPAALNTTTDGGEGDGRGPAPALPPTVGGVEGYRASATKARSTVRSHLLTLDPERVITTADEPEHWRQFSADVRGWLDELDGHLSGPALKAVR